MRKLTAVLAILVCAPALAELVPVGDPGEGGSWEQRFLEMSETPVDLLGVRMVSEDAAFKSPACFDFSDSSWSVALDGAIIASAWGDNLDTLEWTLHFEGSIDDPLTFDYYAFADGELVSSARCSWVDGASCCMWVVDDGGADEGGGDDDFYTPIPVPGAALLGVIGLGLVGRLRRYCA